MRQVPILNIPSTTDVPAFLEWVKQALVDITDASAENVFEPETLGAYAPIDSPTFTTAANAPTPAPGDNDTSIATTAFVTAAIAVETAARISAFAGLETFPVGGMIIWHGAIADIPAGWALCDGTNGTPDLRNCFVIGAHSDDAGDAKTTITGSPTLTGGSKDAIVPAHTHTGAAASDGAHTHGYDYYRGPNLSAGGGSQPYASDLVAGTTDSDGAHTHTLNVDSTGVSVTDANLPPYYARAFIMKLAA